MNPSENSTTEPKHLVGVPKTCPRLDCPNPTMGIVWRGSWKQLQYHCYGCWRKFNYGGILRSWVKQVSPPTGWLRRHAPDVKEAPKLLELQRPRRSVQLAGPSAVQDDDHDTTKGPSRKRSHGSPTRQSVAKSSATEDDTANAVHAAEPSEKRTRRANVNHMIYKKGTTAIATSGEDHGIGIAGSSTLRVIEVVTKFNGYGAEEAHHGPGTQTTPTSDNTTDLMNNLDDLHREDGVHTPVWQSFMSPEAHVLWDDEVDGAEDDEGDDDEDDEVDGAGILSVAAIDNNPIVQGTSGLINAESGDATEPRRRAMTITFRRYSVPSKTFYYGLQD